MKNKIKEETFFTYEKFPCVRRTLPFKNTLIAGKTLRALPSTHPQAL